MKGVILVNAYSQEEEYLYQAERMKEELEKRGVATDILRNDSFRLIVDKNKIGIRNLDYDFFIYWDKDKYILEGLDGLGKRIFNKQKAIADCDDKMTTYLRLAEKNIPLPKTLPGLLCYYEATPLKEEGLDLIEKELPYPMVVKEAYGSLGKGVYLAKNREELRQKLEKIKTIPHLIQEYISQSYGKDIRVIVINKQYVGAMLRKSNKDFRSNIAGGGAGERIDPPESLKRLAERVAEILDLDYCGCDFLIRGEEDFVLCEVNSNAFFCAFEKVTGINVASIYADHILSTTKD